MIRQKKYIEKHCVASLMIVSATMLFATELHLPTKTRIHRRYGTTKRKNQLMKM